MLNDIETDKNKEFVKLGFQAHYPQLETKIVIQAEDKSETDEILQPIIETVRERFGNFIIAEDNATLEGSILAELARTNSTLATAEMYTSGAIAARLNPPVGDPDPVLRSLVSRDLKQLSGPSTLLHGRKLFVLALRVQKKLLMLLELRRLQPMPSLHC